MSPSDRPSPASTPDPGLEVIEERLRRERPVPGASFRGTLRRQLLALSPPSGERPARLRLLVASYAGSGALLLLVAAAGVAGAGPLAF